MPNDSTVQAAYRISGMDCPSCVKKIEDAAHAVEGDDTVEVSLATQMLRVTTKEGSTTPRLPTSGLCGSSLV